MKDPVARIVNHLKLLAFLLLLILAMLVGMYKAHATDLDGQWKNSPNSEWYQKQLVTPQTKKAYGTVFESCCDTGDVCQECVVHKYSNHPPWSDGFYYEKDGKIKQLPPHIVEFVPWTPTGKPVLFLYPYNDGPIEKGTPVCLKVPGGDT